MIELRDIHFTYPQRNQSALNQINLEIQEGDIWFIQGNNGSGKTTLLKLISGLIPKFSGGQLRGNRLLRSHPYEEMDCKTFSMIFHGSDQQFIQSRVDQEILFLLESQKFSKDHIHIVFNEIIRDFQLEKLMEREIQSLSSGERQILKIALGFVLGCPVIVMDEPLAYLDSVHRDQVVHLLYKLQRQKNLTYIVADHNIKPWKIFGDRLRVLNLSNSHDKEDFYLEPKVKQLGSEILFHFDQVSFSFNHRKLLYNLQKSVRAGEKIVITGSNGSGKTTLLNLIMGNLMPNSGSVVRNPEVNFRMLSNVATDYFFSMRVRDEYSLEGRTIDNNNPFHIQDLKDAYVFDLSHGERKKTAMDLILNKKVDVILLDEPWAHLDSQSRRELPLMIDRWIDFGKTVVITTHDATIYRSWATQIWDLS